LSTLRLNVPDADLAASILSATAATDWNPEDEMFWNSKGKFVAGRNLIWSIVAEVILLAVAMRPPRANR
jgi:hypothetical protein